MAKRLCSICGLEEAVYKCRLCGRWVCSRDYDSSRGVCITCKYTLCRICGRYHSIGYCRVCGRIGCEECLIQETLVTYICRECYERLKK